jgi:DNA-3-methyladenine glycosylase II
MSTKIISHFKKTDPKLFKVLEKVYAMHGDEIFTLRKHDFLFDRLVESIISQQLSVRVADVIYGRVLKLMPKQKLTPEGILKNKDEDLRKAGMSFGKIKYLKDLSTKVESGELDLDNLENLENEEVIKELTKVKGIGKWTAEMFLMSALGRPDIFSHGDLGLQNAVKKIYGLEKYEIEIVEKIVIKWSPYRTIAARILWKSLSLKEDIVKKLT